MTISELTRAAIEAHVGSGPRRRLGAAAGGSERTGRRLRAHRGDHCRGGSAIALIIDSGPLYAYVDAEVRFLGGLAVGSFRLEPVHPSDLIGMAELVARYRDLPLGSVDASVLAAAERRGIVEVATLDHPHFRVVRPKHTETLRLLP